jgi:formamidopyrimidine-DNA glycosylase
MPELPDVAVYVESLARRVVGHPLSGYAILSPLVPRSVEPSLDDAVGRVVHGIRRLGKRIVFSFEGELYLVIHLMIAGRFRGFPSGTRAKLPPRVALALLEFSCRTAHRPGRR